RSSVVAAVQSPAQGDRQPVRHRAGRHHQRAGGQHGRVEVHPLGSNNPQVTGDLCWDGDSPHLTISLNGTNPSLVRDDSSGQWRAATDANWRIQLLGSPASPSSGTSERWVVTTTDGIRYYFASEPATSNSRLTVPVFGNHSGEPCRASAFADSACDQAYRWLLDKVVDV